jgi:hypothetical protein
MIDKTAGVHWSARWSGGVAAGGARAAEAADYGSRASPAGVWASFDDFVGAQHKARRKFKFNRLCSFELMTCTKLVGCSTGMSAGLTPRSTLATCRAN